MALRKPAALSADEAALRGARIVHEQKREVPLVAYELIDLVDPDEWRDLAARGLAKGIHDQLENLRNYAGGAEFPAGNEANRGPIRHLLPRQTHPAKDFWALALSQTYRVGSERKRILDFTLADAQLAADTYRARAYGNFAKADAFKLAAKLLKEHRVETIRSLPITAQQSISEALR